ncbi:unnamed protein product [Caenorhabditis auriculariae]|uniref:Acyl-CoA-binding domain-containing protein 6 n=1 Tax=Caenorhabditis auriculariae TaxID=2777116 RepID=A0A8S1GRU3_9PELO|nr:unnamed protein product [Caenorhabditis auriculariae]
MPVSEDDVKQRLQSLEPSHLKVVDQSDGCGAKFLIEVVSEQFNAKTTLASHRIIYEKLADVMDTIHAMFAVHFGQVFQKWRSNSGGNSKENEETEETEEIDDGIDIATRKAFNSAAVYLPNVIGTLDRTDTLQFYGLYKQACCGPPDESQRPSWYDVQSRAKFESWLMNKNLTREEAMHAYCEKLRYHAPDWNPATCSGVHGWGNKPSRMADIESDYENVPHVQETRVETPVEREWFMAMQNDDVDKMRRLLAKDSALLEATDQHLGMTALLSAVDRGCEKVIDFLIMNGANVNATDSYGSTPLHFAAQCHRVRAAELLLGAGAAKNVQDADGKVPAECCDDAFLSQLLRP